MAIQTADAPAAPRNAVKTPWSKRLPWRRAPGSSEETLARERPSRLAMSVAMRVSALAAGAVISMLLVLAIYAWLDQRLMLATSVAQEETALREQLDAVAETVAGMEQIRLVSGSMQGDALVPVVETLHLDADRTIEAMLAVNGRSAVYGDTLAELRPAVADLATGLVGVLEAETAVGLDDGSGLLGVLLERGAAIESQLAELETAGGPEQENAVVRLQRSVFELSRLEKTVMAASDRAVADAAVDDFLAVQTAFFTHLVMAGLPAEAENALIEAIDAYGTAFEAYTKADAARADQRKLAERAYFVALARLDVLNTERDRIAEALNTQLADTVARGRMLTYGTAICAVIVLIALGVWVVLSIVPPLRRIVAAMGRVSGGALDEAIPGHARRDEIGEMARALVVFRDNARETVGLRAAESDRRAAAEADRKAAMDTLADELEAGVASVVSAVSETSTEMRGTSSRMNEVVAASSTEASEAASAAGQASRNVDDVARSAQEMSASVAEIGQQARRSAGVVRDAVEQTRVADEGVTELSVAASGISDVVDLISQIAEQTNLLALNATIEASRAGEAGRGFTVVANEVKSLAGQTAKATQEIASRIQAMQKTTQSSTQSVQAIGRTVREVDEIVALIAAAVEQQEATTASISRSMDEASSGTREVSNRIDGLDANTSKVRGAAENVSRASEALGGHAKALHERITEVIAGLRAA